MKLLFSALACALPVVFLCTPLCAADPVTTYELFDAVEREAVAVDVIPHSDRRITLAVTNLRDEDVVVRIDGPIAAMPVLAQFQQPGIQQPFGQPLGQPQQNQPQNLGVGIPGRGGPFGGINQGQNPLFNQGNNGGINRRNNPFGPGLFSVPAGRTVKRRFPAVCLQHGFKTPNPRMEYRLARLSDTTSNESIPALLSWLGTKQCSQESAQLAAWHLASEVSWEELAKTKRILANGRTVRLYNGQQLSAAKSLAAAAVRHSVPRESTTVAAYRR